MRDRAGRAAAAAARCTNRRRGSFMAFPLPGRSSCETTAPSLAHDPEKAWPGLDPGWVPKKSHLALADQAHGQTILSLHGGHVIVSLRSGCGFARQGPSSAVVA